MEQASHGHAATNLKSVRFRSNMATMGKTRVIIETVTTTVTTTSHQVLIERDGERVLYADTDDLDQAMKLKQKAKAELGIGHPGKRTTGKMSRSD
jgi:hypothetical protein